MVKTNVTITLTPEEANRLYWRIDELLNRTYPQIKDWQSDEGRAILRDYGPLPQILTQVRLMSAFLHKDSL